MLRNIILSDCRRHGILNLNFFQFIKVFILQPLPGLKFMIVFRFMQFQRNKKNGILFLLSYLFYRRLRVKYGIDISYRTQIGPGLYIGHFGGIVVHGDCVIGENCNISHGVTLGVLNHGVKEGTPKIGNEVFIGPGACVLGKIIIGCNVTIGANCVVTESINNCQTIIATRPYSMEKDLSKFYVHNVFER